MLYLYYARASKDVDGFLYEKIKTRMEEKNIILVPDQFTLQEERIAFDRLKVQGMMNVEIMSFSRLGSRILSQAGGTTRTYIDELGKFMLLSKIIHEQAEDLCVFSKSARRNSLVKMLSSLIGEMKQCNVTPEDLKEAALKQEEDSLTKRKLMDVQRLFFAYEEAIKDRYVDTEDSIALFTQKIQDAQLLKGAHVYIEGFDYYTKKTLEMIKEILKNAGDLTIFLTLDQKGTRDRELFELGQSNFYQFKKLGESLGIEVKAEEILGEGKEKSKEIIHLEKEFHCYPSEKYKEMPKQIQVVACSNFYTEAQTIAGSILELVRAEGYRYRDIAVVCNDMEGRGTILSRTFQEHGISGFIDKKRSVMHNPFVEFVLAIFEVVSRGYHNEDVFRLLKTGILDMSNEEIEELENYGLKYKIRGSKWKKAFVKWEEEDPEKLERLNKNREIFIGKLEAFEKIWSKQANATTTTHQLYEYLKENIKMEEKIMARADEFQKEGLFEYASEMIQLWNFTVSILDQMIALLGENKVSRQVYGQMIGAAFENLEIGMIPSTLDQVIVGTMQRTRVGEIKALFVMGANEGVLPATGGEEGIFHEREKEAINQGEKEFYKGKKIKEGEERLAIYKMLSKPTNQLVISYAGADSEGKELLPSRLIHRVEQMFPQLVKKKDVVSMGLAKDLISEPNSALRYISQHIRNWEALPDERWRAAFDWLLKNRDFSKRMDMMKEGLTDEHQEIRLGKKVLDKMFEKEVSMSPTRIETFSRCPFSHFIKYGIRPDEQQLFEVAAPEIGFLFHDVIMKYSMQIEKENSYENITKTECEERVADILKTIGPAYKQGILLDDPISLYRYSRIEKVCCITCWMMTLHMKQGSFTQFFFEVAFGRDRFLPPIVVETTDGTLVYLEGRIDRMDIMEDGQQSYVKIIDYKSGKDKVEYAEMISGWKMQLMLYMNAAIYGLKKNSKEREILPAGIFYFKVGESGKEIESKLISSQEALKKTLEDEVRKSFRMDGIFVDEIKIIEGLDNEITGYSDIIKAKRTKDNEIKGTGSFSAASSSDFEELRESVMELTKSLCNQMIEGVADIRPKKSGGDVDGCTYCRYKTICRYEGTFGIIK